MALRDQPYLPLYVQDYLTDERLNMCSASAQGIYIKIMCLFHKSEPYGGILLKQNFKQTSSTCLNFASMFAKLLPFTMDEIASALEELTEEKVLLVEGDFMYQKRMVNDNKVSELRSISGRKGGMHSLGKQSNFACDFAQAKIQANSENENENYIINNTVDNIEKETPVLETEPESELWKATKKWMKENCPRVMQMKDPLTEKQFDKLRKEYSSEQIKTMLLKMHNYKPLHTKCVSANLTFRNWASKDFNKMDTPKKVKQNLTPQEWMS